MGCLGTLVNATHALTCGDPDRESNETKYLREATDMIEEWQGLLQRGPLSLPPVSTMKWLKVNVSGNIPRTSCQREKREDISA